MSTHRGLATSNGKSLVIISPSGNWLAFRKTVRQRAKRQTKGQPGSEPQAAGGGGGNS